jgi:hypothetical protein
MKRTISLLTLLTLFLSACGAPAATATPPPAESTAPPTVEPQATEAIPATGESAAPTASPPPAAGAEFKVIGVLNRDTTQAAQNPSLVINRLSADNQSGLWAVWAENLSGGPRQVFSSELDGESFQARGASLNIHANVAGDFPTITLSGEGGAVPWVAWSEPSPGFNDVSQIFASRFNAQTGLWQQAGQDRGGGEASLNLQTNRNAAHPFIFAGSGDPTSPTSPWVAWEEPSINSNATQIFVSKGVKDDSGPAVLGGFRWEPVGLLKASEPTLNVDPFRSSFHPTGVFAETSNAVPWVTWHETGGDRPSRIFTARGVADANAPGGFKWISVPPCQPNDETTCALNINPLQDAKDTSMAAGSLTTGESTVPWIAWPEVGSNGKWQIFVSRLDTETRNSFLQVGASLNVDPNHDARTPIITFVGNVPYVVWLEDGGTGKFEVQVRHLASDPQTGTWALDTPDGGFNVNADLSDFGVAAVASNDTLFMTWTEGDPASTASQLVVGALRVAAQ